MKRTAGSKLPLIATVQKFVGVGASRVRKLFERARSHEGGAVIFIDEIDAVARARTAGERNGEREQTLNQILVELDGFSTRDRIICIAATNRLDVLVESQEFERVDILAALGSVRPRTRRTPRPRTLPRLVPPRTEEAA